MLSIKRGKNMELERAKELVNILIEYMLVGEKISNVIEKLLELGFTAEELINEFSFSEEDVNLVANNK